MTDGSAAAVCALAVDPAAAADVAQAHQTAPTRGDAVTRLAYARLAVESDRLFRTITSASWRVRVCFTRCPRPYASADEMLTSIRRDRLLEVTAARCDRGRLHPLLDCGLGGTYDRFRAVHDVLGHGWLGVGFDRDGEYAAWRFQERLHSRLARRALATELHAEHSVHWTTGGLPEHKAVLLDERLLDRSRRRLS